MFRRGKYNNKRTVYGGLVYDSKLEAGRAYELDMLKRAGEVIKWDRQIKFPIVINGIKICDYIADFKVWWKNGNVAIEDTKGVKTDVFRLKQKLILACYGIEIIDPYKKKNYGK